jgi:hypothetical protein
MLTNAEGRLVIWSCVGLEHHRPECVAAPRVAASEAAATGGLMNLGTPVVEN